MRKTYKPLLLLTIFFLVGCSSFQALSAETTTSTPYPATATLVLPTPFHQLTNTPTPLVGQALQYNCQEVLPSLPDNTSLSGTLVLDNKDTVLFLNLESGKRHNLDITKLGYGGFLVSPNGEHVAYHQYLKDLSSMSEWLVIADPDGQQEVKTLLRDDWDGPFWLDNKRMIFSLLERHEDLAGVAVSWIEVKSTIVINPFTNEQQDLPLNYPGLKDYRGAGGNPFEFFGDSTRVVYDPSLSLAVYFQTDENGEQYIALWDRKAGKTLARVKSYPDQPAPMWSPSRKLFYSVGFSAEPQHGKAFYDWFSISTQGHVQQLTHFDKSLDDAAIEASSLSPNGRYLAFWLNLAQSQQDGQQEHLVVLNLDTLETTAYCIPESVAVNRSAPIWSPDSRYIAVTQWLNDNRQSVLILNIENKWIAQLAEDLFVKGWMISVPLSSSATP